MRVFHQKKKEKCSKKWWAGMWHCRGAVILLGSRCVMTAHAWRPGTGPSRHARLKGQDELRQLGPKDVLCGKLLGGQRGGGVGDAALGKLWSAEAQPHWGPLALFESWHDVSCARWSFSTRFDASCSWMWCPGVAPLWVPAVHWLQQ